MKSNSVIHIEGHSGINTDVPCDYSLLCDELGRRVPPSVYHSIVDEFATIIWNGFKFYTKTTTKAVKPWEPVTIDNYKADPVKQDADIVKDFLNWRETKGLPQGENWVITPPAITYWDKYGHQHEENVIVEDLVPEPSVNGPSTEMPHWWEFWK